MVKSLLGHAYLLSVIMLLNVGSSYIIHMCA